ncbi:hydroxyacylglutathione hydrolase [Luteimonas sp. e5]
MSPPEPLPAFNDNYIWWLPATPGPLLVDPGEAAPVLQRFADAPALAGILLTHHHPDHVGGVPELLQRWPDTPVIAPHDERITHATRRVADGDRVALGGHEFEVLAVPGHTRSHIAYLGEGLLFCGDALFSMGCGRMFEGDAPTMLASLDRLAALPGPTRVCCAHEYTLANGAFAEAVMPGQPELLARLRQARQQREAGIPTLPSSIEDERATNPFLRIDDAQVRASIADHLGQAPGDRNAAFAALRAWKDGFKG